MKTLLLSSLVAMLAAGGAAAQATGAGQAEADTEAAVGGAVGLATGALGENFFIRSPQEYHLLAGEMAGMPVYLDATAGAMQPHLGQEPEAAGTLDAAIAEGERPLGAVADVLLDRRGGAAALVLELDPELRGGAREIAVAMGLVRMLPDAEDPATTRILLRLDPADVENAPNFERPGAAPAAATAVQDAQQPQDQPEAQAPGTMPPDAAQQQQPQGMQQDAGQPAQQQAPGQPEQAPAQGQGQPAQETQQQQQPEAQQAPEGQPQGSAQPQGAPQQAAPTQQQ